MQYILKFIKQEDFENHVKQTIAQYGEILKKIDLKKFNKNIVDPIKLLFDKNILNINIYLHTKSPLHYENSSWAFLYLLGQARYNKTEN